MKLCWQCLCSSKLFYTDYSWLHFKSMSDSACKENIPENAEFSWDWLFISARYPQYYVIPYLTIYVQCQHSVPKAESSVPYMMFAVTCQRWAFRESLMQALHHKPALNIHLFMKRNYNLILTELFLLPHLNHNLAIVYSSLCCLNLNSIALDLKKNKKKNTGKVRL